MTMRHLAFALLVCAASVPAHAEIYECIDENGNKRFTNIAAEAKGCRALNMGTPAAAPVTPPPAAAKSKARTPAVTTPSDFPRVERQVQRERDNDRRRILEQELGQEEKLLAQARREFAEQANARTQANGAERIEPLQKRIRLHEDNVANLRKELSRIR